MKVTLRLQNSTVVNEVTLEANTSVIFGRSSSSTFKVSDVMMSGTHCQIMLTPPRLEIIDLASKNGTYLNGIRIEQAELFLGDEIKIGGTKISILQDKMDPATVSALTFPGRAVDRNAHNLQLDFTGARSINQNMLKTVSKNDKRPTSGSINKEVETRIAAHSKIKLSKQEIRLKFKKMASLASTLDAVLMILSLAAPLLVINFLIMMRLPALDGHKIEAIGISVAASSLFVYLVNFKLMKFSLGEKLTGIQNKYLNQ